MPQPFARPILVALLSALLALAVPGTAARASDLRDVLPEHLKSIVLVVVETTSGEGSGTAFAVDQTEGGTLVVTSSHVVKGARKIKVLVGDKELHDARVVADDPDVDLALVEVSGVHLKPLPLAPMASPKIGSDIAVVGYPLADRLMSAGMGVSASLSKGVLSALRQTPYGTVFQVDTPINPGNSGGPAFDWESGLVIGVAMSQLRDSKDINFLVSTDSLRRFLATRPAPGAPLVPTAQQASIAEILDHLGLKYEVDKDGDFKLIFGLEGDRSQLVFINGKAEEYEGIRIREIWSPSFRVPGPLERDLANELLEISQNSKIGAWQVMPVGDERVAVYAVKVNDSLDAPELSQWMDIVMTMADMMEARVTGKDDF